MLIPKKKLKLKIKNNIYIEILEGYHYIKNSLSYEAVYWKQTQFRKERCAYQKSLIKNKKLFYYGNLPQVQKYAKENGIFLEISGSVERLEVFRQPFIDNIILRDYQEEAAKIAIKKQRLVLVLPTGSGKSYIALSIVNAFQDKKCLFLVPNISLLNQIYKDFKKFGLNITKIGGGSFDDSGDCVVSTIQSARKFDFEKYKDFYDLVIQDEAHLLGGDGSGMDIILSNLDIPARVAFTATPPKEDDKLLNLIGHFGEIVNHLDFKKATEKNIILNCKTEIINIPKIKNINGLIQDQRIIDKENNKVLRNKIRLLKDKKQIDSLKKQIVNKTNYQYVVDFFIVRNKIRNQAIVDKVIELNNDNLSCIVFVNMLEHIEILSKMFEKEGVKFDCVHGAISGEEREVLKDKIQKKDIMTLLSSSVFRVGLDLQNLNSIVNAGGGKAENQLLQTVGRVLRVHPTKKYGMLYDFHDDCKYLLGHSEDRIVVYKEQNWLK